MHRLGMTIGSHTMTHPEPAERRTRGRARRAHVVARSGSSRRPQAPVTMFSYPNGGADRYLTPDVQAAVREAGYLAATTSRNAFATAGERPLRARTGRGGRAPRGSGVRAGAGALCVQAPAAVRRAPGRRRRAPALTPRLQVTYVVGSSHSGSTLIAFLADQHPQIASVGETAVKRRIRREGRASAQRCSCGERLDTCPFWQAVFADVSATGIRLSTTRWRTDYRFEHPWLDAVLTRETSWLAWREGRRWATRHLPRLRARTARVDRANVAFVRAVLRRRNASVFLDTTKLLTRLTYLLEIPDFDLQVVRLVRDVRGFAASAQRRGESVDRGHDGLGERPGGNRARAGAAGRRFASCS